MVRTGIGLTITGIVLYISSFIAIAARAPYILTPFLIYPGVLLFGIGIVLVITGLLRIQNDRALLTRGCFAMLSMGSGCLLFFIAIGLALSEIIDRPATIALLVVSGLLFTTIFIPLFWKAKAKGIRN